MSATSKVIKAYIAELPEGADISARELLHLGPRTAIDQALSRAARHGNLIRIERGRYTVPIVGHFGIRTAPVQTVLSNISAATGETIVENGASAANLLGLTTQNPVRYVFWTSGPSRMLSLGRLRVELKHKPQWMLQLPQSRPGSAMRALVWLGKAEIKSAMKHVCSTLDAKEMRELFGLRRSAPAWLARELAALASAR